MEPEIRVTNINGNYHVRLIVGEQVKSEMACKEKEDIGWCSRELLRWYAKLGGQSDFASTARKRQTEGPKGKVWYPTDLPL